MRWQIQEAKARLSRLVEQAIAEGTQTVARHGQDAVAARSVEDDRGIIGRGAGLKALLAEAPLEGIDLERPADLPRDIDP